MVLLEAAWRSKISSVGFTNACAKNPSFGETRHFQAPNRPQYQACPETTSQLFTKLVLRPIFSLPGAAASLVEGQNADPKLGAVNPKISLGSQAWTRIGISLGIPRGQKSQAWQNIPSLALFPGLAHRNSQAWTSLQSLGTIPSLGGSIPEPSHLSIFCPP